MVSVLSEYVHESIVVGLALGETDGSGVEVLLKQCLKLCLGVILIKTDELLRREREERREREREERREGGDS